MSYQEEAEAWFSPGRDDSRIREWGPAVELLPGRPRFCWHNARGVAAAARDEFIYAEGLAFIQGEWVGHGWVVRRSDGEVVECTEGFGDADAYRGICLEVDDVNDFIDSRSLVDGLTLRERMRNYDDDGTLVSEAPGVVAILAEEYVCRGLAATECYRQISTWFDRAVDPVGSSPTPRSL